MVSAVEAVASHGRGERAGLADEPGGQLRVIHDGHATRGWTSGVLWLHGATQASNQGVPMADKSPRQGMSKKSGKSIKEKRAEKHAKASGVTHIAESPVGKKK